MKTEQLAKLARAAISIVEAVESGGVVFAEVRAAQQKARELGRDLTDDELLNLRQDAQSHLDAAQQ